MLSQSDLSEAAPTPDEAVDHLSQVLNSLHVNRDGGSPIPELNLPGPLLSRQVSDQDDQTDAHERRVLQRRQNRQTTGPLSRAGHRKHQKSLAKDGGVLLSNGDEGEGAHEAWLTRRQARRYGW